jgi:pentafunctional AROM polypeptide
MNLVVSIVFIASHIIVLRISVLLAILNSFSVVPVLSFQSLLSSCRHNNCPPQLAFLAHSSDTNKMSTTIKAETSMDSIIAGDDNTIQGSSRGSTRYQDVPIVLVGFSGAGEELMRLADTLVDQYYDSHDKKNTVNEADGAEASKEYADTQEDVLTKSTSKSLKGDNNGRSNKSSIVEVIGRDPEGIFTLRSHDLHQLLDEGSITSQDVIVIDFAHRLISDKDGVHAPQLQARLLEALEYLYHERHCLVIYINVHAESSLMAPIPTLMKDQMEQKLVELSTYELCIKDEGLHPQTIMAIHDLGIGLTTTDSTPASSEKEGEEDDSDTETQHPNSNSILVEDETKNIQDTVTRQLQAWEGVQWELLRIVAHANLPPAVVGSTDITKLMGPHTFFLSLSFDDVIKVQPYVSQLCADVDAMELRVDLLSNHVDRHHVLHQLQLLRRLCRPYAQRAPFLPSCSTHTVTPIEDAIPIVFTVRTAHQAGKFNDDEEGIQRMFQLLKLGLRGATDILDIESAWDPMQTTQLLDLAQQTYPATILLGSHHVVDREISTSEAVDLFLNCNLQGRAHAAKVVLSIEDPSKVYMAYDASIISTKATEARGQRIVPNISLILGTIGEYSRVINPRFTPVTHECLPFTAAPGQLSASDLMKRRIEAGLLLPKKYAILGHNIAYSVSPQMHTAAFAATALPHTYSRADVETVEEFVKGDLFNSQEFGGCSVTIPHKLSIIPYVDILSDAAKAIGSVNTLVVLNRERGIAGSSTSIRNMEQRTIYGDNTDWIGIFNPLKRRLDASGTISSDVRGAALILGGGGTARAAAYAAKQLGLDILYYNRTPSKAKELAAAFGGEVLTSLLADDIEGLGGALSRGGRVLQAVISTLPNSAEFVLPEWVLDKPTRKPIIFDVNYKPYNTPLLIQSENNGCQVVRGSEMLWEQGVQQFELWTERKAPYKVMKNIVLQNCIPSA